MAAKNISVGKVALWLLMALLFLGLAGFGATNLSGTVRSVGSVGDKDIGVERYFRAVQQEMQAFQAQTGQAMSFAEAAAFGIPDRVLSSLVTARALDHEASEMGLSVGDETLARELQQIAAFRGSDGTFNREAYRFALQNIGSNEAEFEDNLRDESARTLLQGAVLAGNRMPDVFAETLVAHALEQRTVTFVTFDQASLTTGVPVPGDADIQAQYDANIDLYTRPETRDITYVWLTPDMILDTVEVDEAALRASFEERTDEFNQPERRLIERLVFGDQAQADAAAARIASGETDFEAEVAARGLALSDIDLGDVTRDEVGGAADAIFAAEVGAVVGPAESALGPALFRVNAVLPEQITTFEEAIPALRDDLALDRARRVIDQLAESVEDLLAGGATLEEVAQETELQLGQIAWAPGEDGDIAGYEAFRARAARLTEEDFPETEALGDGGIFAARLNGINPPAPRPLDEVRDQVAADWELAQVLASLTAQAEAQQARLGEGLTFDALALPGTQTQTVTRDDVLARIPRTGLAALFEMSAGESRVIEGTDSVTLIQLNSVADADLASDDAQALIAILQERAAADISQDLFQALASDIQSRAGIELNQQAITAVHTQLGGGVGTAHGGI